jgi:hypothetical protein
MTDAQHPADPAPPPAADHRKLFIAVGVTLLVVLGLSLVARRWVRGGGPRRAITELAEEGAVKLADALVDEVLPAA